jgi:hypothetical protein
LTSLTSCFNFPPCPLDDREDGKPFVESTSSEGLCKPKYNLQPAVDQGNLTAIQKDGERPRQTRDPNLTQEQRLEVRAAMNSGTLLSDPNCNNLFNMNNTRWCQRKHQHGRLENELIADSGCTHSLVAEGHPSVVRSRSADGRLQDIQGIGGSLTPIGLADVATGKFVLNNCLLVPAGNLSLLSARQIADELGYVSVFGPKGGLVLDLKASLIVQEMHLVDGLYVLIKDCGSGSKALVVHRDWNLEHRRLGTVQHQSLRGFSL